jgi:hypothetical protein
VLGQLKPDGAGISTKVIPITFVVEFVKAIVPEPADPVWNPVDAWATPFVTPAVSAKFGLLA